MSDAYARTAAVFDMTVAKSREEHARLEDFYAFLPDHKFIYIPTGDLWPAASVNGKVKVEPEHPETSQRMKPADYLDRFRAVDQMTWHPAFPQIIKDKVVQGGGWMTHSGSTVFNHYRPASSIGGDPLGAERWRDHLAFIYPKDADHIERWLAFKVQRPGEKINHALVLGGEPGIGKDSILEPAKRAVGGWNWTEISPPQMLGQFTGFFKSVILRVNEARDLGEIDRFAFYDHSKTLIAAPPDVLRCNEKHVREYAVFNVVGVIITSNHLTDGLYLPPDDRRHFVAWSGITRETFSPAYWTEYWQWLEDRGASDVGAYLRSMDLSGFDPKAPPPRTPAFDAIVQSNQSPVDSELSDVLEALNWPEATTLGHIVNAACARNLDVAEELRDRRSRRSTPHKMERVGYVPVRNPDADDGQWKVDGKRQVVYGKKGLTLAQQLAGAKALCR